MAVPTLSDAKAQLNITGSTHDTELGKYLAAALVLVEARVGPSAVRTFTESVTTHAPGFNLAKRPIVSIVSIEPALNGLPSFTAADVAFDAKAGTVWRTDLGSLAGAWDVTYTAGWATFPENYSLATIITCQHLWTTQRGVNGRPNQGGGDSLTLRIATGMGRELLRNSLTLPAMAEALIADGPHFGGIA